MFKVGDEVISPSGVDLGRGTIVKIFRKEGRAWVKYERSWLLKNYAKPGDKILDTHIGSGSIRIACHDMGFELHGCELDKDYFEAQESRFKKHTQQDELFSFEGGEIV
jgi:tRNA/tmRNA/rRNA uracil-C5-methylase (TrmA/RlmC/RlmD family)